MENGSILNRLISYYHENKLSHAYLIETNDINRCFDELKYVVKNINCPKEYKEDCTECNLCNLLKNNYLPSFIVVEAEGNIIKKEQVLELKSRFSALPTYTKENIYIIKEAEKLNAESANTMLKFVEEPEDHIIGFFLTNNLNNVINTIKSRCEILQVNYEQKIQEELLENPYLEVAQEYIKNVIENNQNTIMINRDIILANFSDREEIQQIFLLLAKIFKKAIDIKRGQKDSVFSEKFPFLIEINFEELLKKEKIIVKYIEEMNYNINIELFLDKFIIELSGLNG